MSTFESLKSSNQCMCLFVRNPIEIGNKLKGLRTNQIWVYVSNKGNDIVFTTWQIRIIPNLSWLTPADDSGHKCVITQAEKACQNNNFCIETYAFGGWLMNGSGTILPNDARQKATVSSFTRYAIAMIQMSWPEDIKNISFSHLVKSSFTILILRTRRHTERESNPIFFHFKQSGQIFDLDSKPDCTKLKSWVALNHYNWLVELHLEQIIFISQMLNGIFTYI